MVKSRCSRLPAGAPSSRCSSRRRSPRSPRRNTAGRWKRRGDPFLARRELYSGFPSAPTRERPLRGPANTVRSIPHMFSRLGLLLAAGLLASACATTRAAAPVERPPLEVPPVPPRIVEAAPAPDLGNLEPVADLPPEKPIPAASAKPRPSSPRDNNNRDGQKAEAKPPDPLPPVAEPPPSPPPQAAAPPTIRTPATADTAASERQIRDTMQSAQKGLNNVNFDAAQRPAETGLQRGQGLHRARRGGDQVVEFRARQGARREG